METKQVNLKDLQKKLPYKWRVQSFSEYKPECSCVAYIDSRDLQNLLDEVVWPENWQDEYYQVKNTMLCKIWIKINWEWVWKGDGGTETDIESEKWELSDSFKRAGIKWWAGRFLYDLDIVKLQANEVKNKQTKNYPYPVDNGKRIWDITEYINGLNGKPPTQWNNAPIRDDVPQVPTYSPKGKQLAEYIAEIKSEWDSNVIKTLQDEAKKGRLSEKQIAWLDKEVEARLAVLKNSLF